MRNIRAKFKVAKTTKHEWGSEEVELNAVGCDGSNADWCKATPIGKLTMTIDNPDAQGQLIPGKEYFIDISEAVVAS